MIRAKFYFYHKLQAFKAEVSNLFSVRATERKYSGGESHIVNFSLS